MRILVVGGRGLLGTEIVHELLGWGHEVLAPTRAELDLTDPVSVARLVSGEWGSLDWIVNAAAYTQVDQAESDRDDAFAVNALGPGFVGQSASLIGSRLLHISTDFVFGQGHKTPIPEEAETNPLGVYGESKLEGERSVLASSPHAVVFRTSWLFGPAGKCFPLTILKAWLAGKPLRVVNDQFGTPTSTPELAKWIRQAVEQNLAGGLYHAASPEVVSWFDLAQKTLEAAQSIENKPIEIEPVPTSAWPTPAVRPEYSALDSQKLLGLDFPKMAPLEVSLKEFVAQAFPER